MSEVLAVVALCALVTLLFGRIIYLLLRWGEELAIYQPVREEEETEEKERGRGDQWPTNMRR